MATVETGGRKLAEHARLRIGILHFRYGAVCPGGSSSFVTGDADVPKTHVVDEMSRNTYDGTGGQGASCRKIGDGHTFQGAGRGWVLTPTAIPQSNEERCACAYDFDIA